MPRLIHFNGPSRVGKSTLARRYADDHPGTLVLDLDVLAGLVGGWQDDFPASLETARDHGRDLATRHLRSGHDVVFPQLVTVHDEVPDPALVGAADAAGSPYVQVALLVDEAEHDARLQGKRPTTDVEAHVQSALVAPGTDLPARIRGHLAAYLELHPPEARIDTTGLDVAASYARLLATLEGAATAPA